jgi:hypothetical protein
MAVAGHLNRGQDCSKPRERADALSCALHSTTDANFLLIAVGRVPIKTEQRNSKPARSGDGPTLASVITQDEEMFLDGYRQNSDDLAVRQLGLQSFRFLRRENIPSIPKPPANRVSVAGNGVAASRPGLYSRLYPGVFTVNIGSTMASTVAVVPSCAPAKTPTDISTSIV